MVETNNSFWSRIKKSIESDYLGKPLDEDPGLIETISEEVLSKFIKDQKPKIAEKTVHAKPEFDKTEIDNSKNELLQQIQTAVRTELDKGKNTRRLTNIIVWIITLIAGGFVGILFQKYITL
jgi:hypothetical protein